MSARAAQVLRRAHPSYNHCGLCGREPRATTDAEMVNPALLVEPNYAPVRWWDPDDGWKITSLCRPCITETADARPMPGDYAYDTRDEQSFDNVATDEDPSEAL